MELEKIAVGSVLVALEDNVRDALCVFLSGTRSVRRRVRHTSDAWRSFTDLLPGSRRAIDALRTAGIAGVLALEEFERAVLTLEGGRTQRVLGGSEREMAQMVAAGCRLLDTMYGDRKALATAGEHWIAAPCIDPGDYRDRYLRPVKGLHAFADRALKPYIAGLFLHGSLATLDFACDYSDFDTLIVVRRGVVLDCDRLLEFLPIYRRSMCYLFEFDPLQHHAHILLTEIDLESYSDTLFPLDILDHARSLGTAWSPLRVGRRNCEGAVLREFERVCTAFSRLAESRYYPDNAYDLKSFLSELMLLPALYLQSLGQPCYKKYSFARSAPDFPAEDWSVMEEASAIRAGWRYERRGDVLSAAGAWMASPELTRRLAANPSSTVVREAERIAGYPLGAGLVTRAAGLASAMRMRVRQAAGEKPTR